MRRRDHHPGLRADVVAGPDHVHPHRDQPFGGRQVVLIRDFEDAMGPIGIGHKVHHQLRKPAQGPGGLEDRGHGDADDEVLVLVLREEFLGVRVEFWPVGIRSGGR